MEVGQGPNWGSSAKEKQSSFASVSVEKKILNPLDAQSELWLVLGAEKIGNCPIQLIGYLTMLLQLQELKIAEWYTVNCE
jgi:hypothetical protein